MALRPLIRFSRFTWSLLKEPPVTLIDVSPRCEIEKMFYLRATRVVTSKAISRTTVFRSSSWARAIFFAFNHLSAYHNLLCFIRECYGNTGHVADMCSEPSLYRAFLIFFNDKKSIFAPWNGLKCFQLFFPSVEIYFVENKCSSVSKCHQLSIYCKFVPLILTQFLQNNSFISVSDNPLFKQMNSNGHKMSGTKIHEKRDTIWKRATSRENIWKVISGMKKWFLRKP